MSRKSIETPPCGALTWPSSEVPVPKGMTGTLCFAQMRTTCCTSAVDCGNTTASGGWFGIQVSVWPCCSRTACEVTSRLPKAAARSRIAASFDFGSRAAAGMQHFTHGHSTSRSFLLVVALVQQSVIPLSGHRAF